MSEQSLDLLLVDDEETFVAALAMHLRENYGYKTTIANSGREAIGKIQGHRSGYDVILLDYKMPDLNGLNVLQWMLEEKNTTPVIMLTAAGSEQVAVEALKLGAYDYVRKELIDLDHIEILIRGVHERHLFRAAEAIEREKQDEMAMNNYATDLVRLVINAVTPKLNTTLAQITSCAESDPKETLSRLPADVQGQFQKIFGEILSHTAQLETITKGMLQLFQLLYAHHSELPEIENIKHWFQKELQITQDHIPLSSWMDSVTRSLKEGEVPMPSVLVVDDDEMMLNALKTLLEDEQFRVTTVTDGHKGIQIYKRNRPDIVLLDLKLPSITGLDILRAIREFDPDAKVIIITGFASPEAMEEAQRLGALGFYEKSRDVEELVGMVRRSIAETRELVTRKGG